MTRDEIRRIVVESLTSNAPEVDPASLAPSESFRDSFDLDSMDFLRFVSALNDAVGVAVPEADYARVDSLDGALEYLEPRIDAARRGA